MGEKAKMIMNEYTGLGILLRPDFDVNKFYSSDLKVFIKTARKALEDYKTKMDKAIEYHNNCIENLELSKINDNEKLAYQVACEIHKNYLNILQGSDKG